MPPPRTAIRHISRLARRQPLSTSARRLDSHHSAPHDPAPAAESFGRSFYLVLALIPSTYIVYNISKDPGNSLTQSLRKWSDFKDYWAAQNALHARMVEQAGHDRNLFTNSPSPVWHDLQFPEVFSMGSPIAVPAGHMANMDHVIEHYRQRNAKEEAEKLDRLAKRKQADAQTSERR